ncbi:MAG: MFS transporter [Candidatus Xenobia bacterium]
MARVDARVVLGGAFVFTAGLAAMPSSAALPSLLLACVLMATGHGCCYPALLSLMSTRVPDDAQGTLQGVTQSVSSLGRMVGPVGSGALYGHLGTASPWLAAAACTAATAALAASARGLPRATPRARNPLACRPGRRR